MPFSEEKDKGVLVTDGPKLVKSDSSKGISIYNMPQSCTNVCRDNVGDRVPVMADFLLAFSTTHGNYNITEY